MSYDHTNTRVNKKFARATAVDNDGLLPRLVALFITVPGIPDIKKALAAGLITTKTFIIAVNHCRKDRNSPYDKRIAAQIKRDLTRLGFRYILIDEFLESIRGLTMISDTTEKYGKIDYAFIDLCGYATPSFCSALNKLQDSFAKEARIAITICTHVRQPKLIAHWQKVFNGELDTPTLQILSTPNSGDWLGELFGGFKKSRADIAIREGQVKHIYNFLWQFQAIVAAFDKYVTNVSAATKYRDCMSMGLVVFDVVRQSGGNQLFHFISETCDNAKPPGSNGDRSLTSYQRACATRRANTRKETK